MVQCWSHVDRESLTWKRTFVQTMSLNTKAVFDEIFFSDDMTDIEANSDLFLDIPTSVSGTLWQINIFLYICIRFEVKSYIIIIHLFLFTW